MQISSILPRIPIVTNDEKYSGTVEGAKLGAAVGAVSGFLGTSMMPLELASRSYPIKVIAGAAVGCAIMGAGLVGLGDSII